MKIFFLLITTILLVACSISHPIKHDIQHESNPDENISISILDSIYVDSDYEYVGKKDLRFMGIYGYEDPFPIERHPVEYPKLAINNGIEGSIILQVEISVNGSVEQVLVKKSLMLGSGGLDEAAVNSVIKWKYSPAKYKGKPVACWTTFPVNFSLH